MKGKSKKEKAKRRLIVTKTAKKGHEVKKKAKVRKRKQEGNN